MRKPSVLRGRIKAAEVRAVNMAESAGAEAKKLGFEVCILPEVAENHDRSKRYQAGRCEQSFRCHELSEIKKLYEFYKK